MRNGYVVNTTLNVILYDTGGSMISIALLYSCNSIDAIYLYFTFGGL